jgi:nitrogen fixation protein FixH
MNTMTTLFGGLAAVFVLYALGGFVRGLTPPLRAVLAGIIPLLAYALSIVGRWPGLDVAAIHISVFLVAALVLFAMGQFRRRGAGRMHWVPKLLTVFFIGLVFVNAALLYIATQGLPEPLARWWLGSKSGGAVYSGFSGVVAHGQNAAKAVSSELSAAHRESLLGWQVELDGLDEPGLSRAVTLRVRDRTGLPVERVDAEVRLMRPGATAPVLTLPLAAADAGVYVGTLVLPEAGRWLAEVRLARDGKQHFQHIQELVAQ